MIEPNCPEYHVAMRWIIAIHEAGHAAALVYGWRFRYVTIASSDGNLCAVNLQPHPVLATSHIHCISVLN